MLGAILLSEQALDSAPDRHPAAAGRLLPRRATGSIFGAMLRAEGEGRARAGRRRSRCRDELARAGRARGGGRRRRTSTRCRACVPAAGERPPLRADRQASTRCCAACSPRRARSRRTSSPSSGDARELIEQAEAELFRIAHEDRTGELRLDRGRPPRRARQARAGLARGHLAHRHAVRLQGPRRPDGRLPARQPDRAGGAARRWASPRSSRTSPRTPPSTTASRSALFSLEMSETELAQRFIASQAKLERRRPAQGPRQGRPLAEGASRPPRSSRRAALHRRLERHRHPRAARQGAPAARPAGELGLVIVDYLQLMRRRGQLRQPRRADRPDQPRAEDPRARARRSR